MARYLFLKIFSEIFGMLLNHLNQYKMVDLLMKIDLTELLVYLQKFNFKMKTFLFMSFIFMAGTVITAQKLRMRCLPL